MLLASILLLGNEADLEAKFLKNVYVELLFPFKPGIEHLHGFSILLITHCFCINALFKQQKCPKPDAFTTKLGHLILFKKKA